VAAALNPPKSWGEGCENGMGLIADPGQVTQASILKLTGQRLLWLLRLARKSTVCSRSEAGTPSLLPIQIYHALNSKYHMNVSNAKYMSGF